MQEGGIDPNSASIVTDMNRHVQIVEQRLQEQLEKPQILPLLPFLKVNIGNEYLWTNFRYHQTQSFQI